LIEDAAEALGSYRAGLHVGGDGFCSAFSFNGNKIITTSGGGMLISKSEDMIAKARFLSTQARDPAPHYLHTQIGYNYRMSNVLAGIGRGQLRVLEQRVEARRAVFQRYRGGLTEIPWIDWMQEPEGSYSNRWLSCFTVNPDSGVPVKRLIEHLAEQHIEGRHIWYPMHQQPLFMEFEYYPHAKDESVSDYLFQHGLCLPSGSNMSISQQQRVIDSILSFYEKNKPGQVNQQ